MRKAFLVISLVLLSLLLIYSGCRVRKNPLRMEIDEGGIFENSFEFSTLENVLDDPVGRTVQVYLPPGFGADTTYSYPVLFLLHGFKEKGWYYKHFYNIKTIADQMISSGEIQPMVIVMPDGSGKFGGSFFTNSVLPDSSSFGGKYEDYLTRELFDKVLYNYGQWMRGVKYKVTPMDSSYTTLDSIPDLDTTCLQPGIPVPDCDPDSLDIDTTRWLHVIDTIIVEWIDTTASISDDTAFFQQNFGISGHGNGGYGAFRIATDYPAIFGSASAMSAPLNFASLIDFIPAFLDSNGVAPNGNGYHQINPDPKRLDRLSCFFFAMAVAFSPHDPVNPDTSTFFRLVPSTQRLGVDLPFDSLGNTVDAIWNKWMENDMKTRILNIDQDSLSNLRFYIDSGLEDEFGFDEQAVTFYNALPANLKANTTFEIYTGYTGYPALSNSFIYDRLRKVLKFHSDSFTEP